VCELAAFGRLFGIRAILDPARRFSEAVLVCLWCPFRTLSECIRKLSRAKGKMKRALCENAIPTVLFFVARCAEDWNRLSDRKSEQAAKQKITMQIVSF